MQCAFIKKNGQQCSRAPSKKLENRQHCWQHQPKKEESEIEDNEKKEESEIEDNEKKEESEEKDHKMIRLPSGESASCWIKCYDQLPSDIMMDDETFNRIWQLHPTELGKGKMFGKPITFQRYTQTYGQDYYYRGTNHQSQPITDPYLQTLLDWVGQHSKLPYKGILINWYQDGNHYIGDHSDNEKGLMPLSPIYSFSFGQERDFVITSKDKSYRKVIPMKHNSLIIMGGAMQKHYKHGVPKQTTCPKSRINITVRLFKE
jgi:alkylated DNA repair dioxygenase AlkB